MFGIEHFALFISAGILLNLTPGPDTVYILGRSIAHGRRAGVASALGISVGSIFHTCAAALGLSALLPLACDEIILVDDGNSAVSLPETPLLGVLPGTGGLTRVVDKRKVRRDLADVFATTAEGVIWMVLAVTVAVKKTAVYSVVGVVLTGLLALLTKLVEEAHRQL